MLATALGLGERGAIFGQLTHAADKDFLDAPHMHTALWPATWGYFLSQMLGVGGVNENPLTDDDIAWLRSHFIAHVRAAGPLPAAARRQAAVRGAARHLARRVEADRGAGR